MNTTSDVSEFVDPRISSIDVLDPSILNRGSSLMTSRWSISFCAVVDGLPANTVGPQPQSCSVTVENTLVP